MGARERIQVKFGESRVGLRSPFYWPASAFLAKTLLSPILYLFFYTCTLKVKRAQKISHTPAEALHHTFFSFVRRREFLFLCHAHTRAQTRPFPSSTPNLPPSFAPYPLPAATRVRSHHEGNVHWFGRSNPSHGTAPHRHGTAPIQRPRRVVVLRGRETMTAAASPAPSSPVCVVGGPRGATNDPRRHRSIATQPPSPPLTPRGAPQNGRRGHAGAGGGGGVCRGVGVVCVGAARNAAARLAASRGSGCAGRIAAASAGGSGGFAGAAGARGGGARSESGSGRGGVGGGGGGRGAGGGEAWRPICPPQMHLQQQQLQRRQRHRQQPPPPPNDVSLLSPFALDVDLETQLHPGGGVKLTEEQKRRLDAFWVGAPFFFSPLFFPASAATHLNVSNPHRLCNAVPTCVLPLFALDSKKNKSKTQTA